MVRIVLPSSMLICCVWKFIQTIMSFSIAAELSLVRFSWFLLTQNKRFMLFLLIVSFFGLFRMFLWIILFVVVRVSLRVIQAVVAVPWIWESSFRNIRVSVEYIDLLCGSVFWSEHKKRIFFRPFLLLVHLVSNNSIFSVLQRAIFSFFTVIKGAVFLLVDLRMEFVFFPA